MSEQRTVADQKWHAMEPAEVMAAQSVDAAAGLTTAEVESRRAKYGPNKFAEAAKEPRWRAFLRQYADPMQIVLLVAGGVFVVAMAVISVSELVLGHPIANAGESGTTLSNLGGSSSSSTSPASTPTGTQSPSPSGTATPTPSDSSSTDASPDPSATSPSLNTTAPTDPTTVPTPGSATTAPSTATTAPTGAGSSSGG